MAERGFPRPGGKTPRPQRLERAASWSLGSRLFAASGFVALLVAAVAVVSLFVARGATASLEHLAGDRLTELKALYEVKARSATFFAETREYLLTGDVETLAQLHASQTALDEALARLVAAGTEQERETDSAAKQDLLKRLPEALADAKAHATALVSLYDAGVGATARAESLAAMEAAEAALMAVLDELLTFVDAAFLANMDDAAMAVRVSQYLLIAFPLIVLALGFVLNAYLNRYIVAPLAHLARTARRIEVGDLVQRAGDVGVAEVRQLAHGFDSMTARLRALIGNLEKRTQEIEVVADLGRAVAGVRDLDTLLPHTVDLIKARTGHAHVQIFLVDETNGHAVLRASTGPVGEKLLQAGHRLAVGSSSVIGQVTAHGEPVIALDTADAAVVHKPNPLLPETRSEMALPLRVEGRIIGALDVQNVKPDAFDAGDAQVFQILADQVAVAIENARLFAESEANLTQIEQLNRRLVGDAYTHALRLRRAATIGYNTVDSTVLEDDQWSPALQRAFAEQTTVLETTPNGRHIALPLVLRGATIGAVEFEIGDEAWSEDTATLARALVARLSDSLETTRLFEQAQRLAARERQVNQVTARLQGASELDRMVTVAAEEIRRALSARRTAVRLEMEERA